VIICRNGNPGASTQQRTGTFTGLVFADPVLAGTDGIVVNNIFFSPGARTYWHSHEHGQILIVISGSGLICQAGGEIQALTAGDLAWSAPGELHWHGAAPATSILHRAISLGQTTWAGGVTDAEYGAEAAAIAQVL